MKWFFFCVAGFVAFMGLLISLVTAEDAKTAEYRQWRREINRKVIENCVNRGGIPTFDKWTGAVDNCVGGNR